MKILARMLAVLLVATSSGAIVAGTSRAAPGRRTVRPVVLIVMENHDYSEIVGNRHARYLNRRFIPAGRLFTRYSAITHPSLPNYLSMTGGSTFRCRNDSCPRNHYRSNNIFNQLEAAGSSWRAYQESMPSPCDLHNRGRYAVRHNPALYYTDIIPSPCSRWDRRLPRKLPRRLAPFTFVTPNLCNDMHDCSVATGDRWLARHVPDFLHRGAVVIVTFDEGSAGNRVLTAEVGPGIARRSRDRRPYSHFGLLAGLEVHFGLSRLNRAARARPLPT